MTVPDDIARDLERAARRIREATHERDRLIVKARDAGGSLREIAELVGLSHPGVAKVLKRQRD